MCPVCKAQAFVSEACSGSVTCNQCPGCYSGVLFVPSFVPFHLFFMCCAYLLDGLADMNNSHQVPCQPISVPNGKLALTTLFLLLSPMFGVLMFHYAYQSAAGVSENISSWPSHHCKQIEVKSIDYFDLPSVSAPGSGFLCCSGLSGEVASASRGSVPFGRDTESISTDAFQLNALWWVTKYQWWVVCTL